MMIWLSTLMALAVGMVIGSYLPVAVVWCRNFRRRSPNRPVVLKLYRPNQAARNGSSESKGTFVP